ncbi:MAG: peptidase [Pseudomonadales bacterium]|nr:peptidase [Pseudomonadales bacterium]MCP5184186.1 peptidase [Pseudomonadales bacterium]
MTYCVSINVKAGLVLVSDSRTNAGMDSVSTHSKMRRVGVPGERQFIICCSGNLATTQGVFANMERDIRDGAPESLMTVRNVSEGAAYIGALSRREQEKTPGGPVFEASFLVAGEVLGARCRSYMVYPEGNFIESSDQVPYLQIGESKYGKPILDRVITMNSSLDEAALCALVSMDGTMRSNLTVGPPIEVATYMAGSLQPGQYRRFDEDDDYLREVKRNWNKEIKVAFARLPGIDWYADGSA